MGTITLSLPVAHTSAAAGQIAGDLTTIQTVINGGLDNNNLAPGFKRTTSAYSGGPPGSPVDGDIWIATAVEGSANRWSFQYESAWVADAYKWKFVGGSPLVFFQEGSLTTTSASYTSGTNGTGTVTATTYTPTRSGIYQARAHGVWSATVSGSTGDSGLSMGGTVYTGSQHTFASAGGFAAGWLAEMEAACVSGGNIIVPVFSVNLSATLTVYRRRLVVVPSRII